MKKNTINKLNGKKPEEVKNMYESFLANPSQSGVTYISNYKKAYLKDEIKMALKKACGSDNLYAIIDVNLLNKALNELAVARKKHKNDKTTDKRYSDYNSYLKKYIQFVENYEVGNPEPEPDPSGSGAPSTSLENLEQLATQINETLETDLLDTIKKISPKSFEYLIKELLVKMDICKSNKCIEVTSYSGDGGVDINIFNNPMKMELICCIQVKRYTDTAVGLPTLKELGGTLLDNNCKNGMVITTSRFTKNALEYNPGGYNIQKIDGEQLIQLMIEYELGINTKMMVIKTVDVDYLSNLLTNETCNN